MVPKFQVAVMHFSRIIHFMKVIVWNSIVAEQRNLYQTLLVVHCLDLIEEIENTTVLLCLLCLNHGELAGISSWIMFLGMTHSLDMLSHINSPRSQTISILDMNVLMPEMIFLHNFKMLLQLVAASLTL